MVRAVLSVRVFLLAQGSVPTSDQVQTTDFVQNLDIDTRAVYLRLKTISLLNIKLEKVVVYAYACTPPEKS